MKWNLIQSFLTLMLVYFSQSSFAQADPFHNPDVYPRQDYVVFSRLGKMMEEIRTVTDWGVLRDDEPRQIQWIEEIPREDTPTGALAPVRYVSLKYILTSGKSNGFWIRLRRQGQEDSWFDWNGFRDSTLILRVGTGESCTRRFRLEIKYYDSQSDTLRTAYTYIDIDSNALNEIDTQGYADITIPLRTIVGTDDLSSMRELVLLFEGDQVTELQCELKLFNIRIATPPPNIPDVNSLLEDLNKRAYSWFVDNRHPVTGLIRDRRSNSVGLVPENDIGSIASVGFYLSALPNAIESGWIDSETARQNAITVLEFLWNRVENYYGIFPHFLFLSTGERAWKSEFSLLDSALLLNGCMVASVCFGGEATHLVNAILDRIDWTHFLMSVNGRTLLSMGWSAEQQKLLGPMDVRASEFSMPIFLAIGSGQVDKEIWYNTKIEQSRIAIISIYFRTPGTPPWPIGLYLEKARL